MPWHRERRGGERCGIMRDQALLTDLDRPDAAALSPWGVAVASLLLIFIGWGAPYLIAVALKPMAAELGAARSVPSLASSLCYIGIGVGGSFIGPWGGRVRAQWAPLFGSCIFRARSPACRGAAEPALFLRP